MMTPQQAELFAKIEAFAIDDGTPELTFVQRLTGENAWSPDYAARVVAEYRKFLFLASAAGHPVSPSKAVDEAWHLHLTYTRSYWDRLCGQVLGKPLHHGPTRGGEAEEAKYKDWYANTLSSYRKFFGTEPPTDIWGTAPAEEDRPAPRPAIGLPADFAKPGGDGPHMPRIVIAAGVVVASAVAISAVIGGRADPFGLTGPEFLGFYILWFIVTAVTASRLRKALRTPDDRPAKEHLALDPYEAALLADGPVQAVNTAIAVLMDQGKLKLTEKRDGLQVADQITKAAHPMERAVFSAVSGGQAGIGAVRTAVADLVVRRGERLRELGLVVTDGAVGRIRWAPLLLVLAAVGFGVLRIFQGTAKGRPVAYLVILCIITGIIALAGYARRPYRTRRGDRALAELQHQHRKLRTKGKHLTGSPELALGVALFGMGALAGTELWQLQQTLTPPSSSGGSCGSSCGSSSSSSCGSSCGGGGCGGGGD